nr:hypothetical protein [Carnobacterium iners]
MREYQKRDTRVSDFFPYTKRCESTKIISFRSSRKNVSLYQKMREYQN